MKTAFIFLIASASALFANAMTVQGIAKVDPRSKQIAIFSDGNVSKFFFLVGDLTQHLIENKKYILELEKSDIKVGDSPAYKVKSGRRIYAIAGQLDDRNKNDFQFVSIHQNRFHLKGQAVKAWLDLKKKLPDHDYTQTPIVVNVASELTALKSEVQWLGWQVVPLFDCLLEGRPSVRLRYNKIRADGSRLEALITSNGAGETLFISQGYCQSNGAENPAYQCEYHQGRNAYGTSILQKEEDHIEGDSIMTVIHRADEAQTKLNFVCSEFNPQMLKSVSED